MNLTEVSGYIIRGGSVGKASAYNVGDPGNRRGKSGSSDWFYFLGLQNHCRW